VIVIDVSNVNRALKKGVALFKQLDGDESAVVAPRGMRTIEAPQPVTTVYAYPTERVLFSPTRDANPFFHFFEALWMLIGRNDVDFLTHFNQRMAAFSDDGTLVWGAYGWRWRQFFGFDQLEHVISLLNKDRASRRGVVAMWSPDGDMIKGSAGQGGITGKDVPCNTHLYLKVRGGALNLTICNRSNDMLWGAYGANAVHMSMLQEYMANRLGVRVGTMTQISDSLHVYLDENAAPLWQKLKQPEVETELRYDPYQKREVEAFPLGAENPLWDDDLRGFFKILDDGKPPDARYFGTTFFKDVVTPLWRAFAKRSLSDVELCAASDWRKACREWLLRRMK
jgi:thymidylate synthase